MKYISIRMERDCLVQQIVFWLKLGETCLAHLLVANYECYCRLMALFVEAMSKIELVAQVFEHTFYEEKG